jgi:hypothetical protein
MFKLVLVFYCVADSWHQYAVLRVKLAKKITTSVLEPKEAIERMPRSPAFPVLP